MFPAVVGDVALTGFYRARRGSRSRVSAGVSGWRPRTPRARSTATSASCSGRYGRTPGCRRPPPRARFERQRQRQLGIAPAAAHQAAAAVAEEAAARTGAQLLADRLAVLRRALAPQAPAVRRLSAVERLAPHAARPLPEDLVAG
ncbi:hypothetical protein [Streptomyces sp. NPDC050504]|uniref:hypothetical protein n=1 Tax=Streptomyces sp. NPDC050504 TaxID=3365618 RepID=UPI003799C596